jgi:hypothetical protein
MATVTRPTLPSKTLDLPRPRLSVLAPLLYAVTLFVSATLLFLVQPMFAKMVLPTLGGTPAVWNTCMVFYQAALLLGYAYAHLSTTWLGSRAQARLHFVVLFLPFLTLPIGVARGWVPPVDANPIPWLLGLLAVSVGLPFVVVSTSAPLLQKWFAGTGHPSSRDPYFLYGASNLGSMLALVGYPVFIEPLLPLAGQSVVWAFGYSLLALLTLGCAVLLWRSPAASDESPAISPSAVARGLVGEVDSTGSPQPRPQARPTLGRRLHWVALALVPSSLMLGVTTHITTDIAAIPLLWVLPLALYLLTFILVFLPGGVKLHSPMVRLMPMVTLLLLSKVLFAQRMPVVLEIGLHLSAFFVITMVCHGELARLRPVPRYLTDYYLLMSLGGVLGGLFTALLAPLAFDQILEYPLALALACLLLPGRPSQAPSRFARVWDVGAPLLVGALTLLVLWVWLASGVRMAALAARVGDVGAIALRLGTCLVPVVVCYACSGRPLRFGLAAGAMLAASVVLRDPLGYVQRQERGFFGQVTVQHDPDREYVWLVHGTTLHGQQARASQRRGEALTYFHRTGPVGQVFAAFPGRGAPRRVGVTGLGIGTMASYARGGESWTFYEIDPLVVRMAEDERHFTYLADCRRRGAELQIVLGDARLQLGDAPAHGYDLLFLDAFSSDSVPVHLLTHEGLRLYLAKLADGGVLVFNISNRYLDLEPVLARLAQEEGLTAYCQLDREGLDEHPGKLPSCYVAMARRPEVLAPLLRQGPWRVARQRDGVGLWTDDFSNLLSVFIWRE